MVSIDTPPLYGIRPKKNKVTQVGDERPGRTLQGIPAITTEFLELQAETDFLPAEEKIRLAQEKALQDLKPIEKLQDLIELLNKAEKERYEKFCKDQPNMNIEKKLDFVNILLQEQKNKKKS